MEKGKKTIFNNHRIPCPTCEGRTCIVCCSVDDNTECETISCPTCHGKGFLVDKHKFWVKIAVAVIFGVVCGNLLFWYVLYPH